MKHIAFYLQNLSLKHFEHLISEDSGYSLSIKKKKRLEGDYEETYHDSKGQTELSILREGKWGTGRKRRQ